MSELFASGRIADLILALIAVEGAALYLYWRATGRGVAPDGFALNLLAGFCLVAALRQALAGGAVGWIGLALACAGLAHAADLRRRWRS